MFGEIFRFDLRYQRRGGMFWLALLLFGGFGFLIGSSDAAALGGSVGNVYRNAPFVVVSFLNAFTLYATFVSAAFMASPVLRDFELNTTELFFTTPIRKFDYLFGRFAAGVVISLAIILFVALGMFAGMLMPWVEADRLGPHSLLPYAYGFAVFVVPNLVLTGAFFVLLGLITRGLLGVYLGLLVFLVLSGIGAALAGEFDYEWLGSLVDPFGGQALELGTRYWSAAERNALLPALTGALLANRLLWLAIAGVLLATIHATFKPQRDGTAKPWFRRRAVALADSAPARVRTSTLTLPPATRRFDLRTNLLRLWKQMRLDASGVLRSTPFIVMLAIALLLFVLSAWLTGRVFGTLTYPVTSLMSALVSATFSLLLFIVVTLFAGELVWKERGARLAEVFDATPTPDWVPLLAKVGALVFVVLAFFAVGGLAAVGFQLATGYYDLQPLLYAQRLLLDALPFVMFGVLALFLQVLVNDKFIGYLFIVVVLIAKVALGPLGFEHKLYNFPTAPPTSYSDMNGFGHFLAGHLWFRAYWGFATLAMLILAAVLWVRGVAGSFPERRAAARVKLQGRLGKALLACGFAFVALGAFIFYNTNVLNDYVSAKAELDRRADFERKYRQYRDLPQPRLTAVKADVDIYPGQRRVDIRTDYTLVNRDKKPIRDLHLMLGSEAELVSLEMPPHESVVDDQELGYRIERLATPLAPGADLQLKFQLRMEPKGFANDRGNVLVVGNGTFFDSLTVFPRLGYDERAQIDDRNERRKRGLGKVERMPALEDEAARANHYLIPHADWIDFEATVSTSADQVALAPGYLEKEWTEGGRRYFHYTMDAPIMPFFAFLSGRWAVKRDRWKDVAIEIYHHPAHAWNVDRMIQGVKLSLDYFTENFSPYQHRQVRIFEFPRFRGSFAQAFANTIPVSEASGFIADLRDPEKIDWVLYGMAHEVAHQWWAHQVIGAAMQGSTLLSESLAQYSALMVMEKQYGRAKMRRFLRHELDAYLQSRAIERVREEPLMRVENQPYMHYNKGSLVFYRLREEIGEAALNRALANLLRDHAFKPAPYPDANDLLAYIRAETPVEKQGLLKDLFETITFYDNRVLEAKAHKRADGKYEVELELSASKLRADGTGKESDAPLDDWIEIAVFSRPKSGKEAEEKVLHLEKPHVTQQRRTVKLVVDSEPYEAGFDPYNKLIDRIPADNRKRITLQ